MRTIASKIISSSLIPAIMALYINMGNAKADDYREFSYIQSSQLNYDVGRAGINGQLPDLADSIDKYDSQSGRLERMLSRYNPSSDLGSTIKNNRNWISRHKVASSFIFGSLAVLVYLAISSGGDKDGRDDNPGDVGGGDEF